MAEATSNSGDECARCKETGEDRRTLWMACLYAMDETGVPFEERMIRGSVYEKTGVDILPTFNVKVPAFNGEPWPVRDHRFFTLRVCKRCRGEWIAAQKAWFESAPEADSCVGTGIWIREFGKLREITLEEWEQRRAEAGR